MNRSSCKHYTSSIIVIMTLLHAARFLWSMKWKLVYFFLVYVCVLILWEFSSLWRCSLIKSGRLQCAKRRIGEKIRIKIEKKFNRYWQIERKNTLQFVYACYWQMTYKMRWRCHSCNNAQKNVYWRYAWWLIVYIIQWEKKIP